MATALVTAATHDSATLPRAWRVEVYRRDGAPDPEGEHARAALVEAGLAGVARVRSARGYLLSPELARADLERIAAELFTDPVLERAELTAALESPAARRAGVHRVLVARRPGVMDPSALTIERTLARARVSARVLTFRVWEVEGRIERAALERAALRALANDVIDEVRVDDERLHFATPGGQAPRALVRVPLRDVGADGLERLSREGCLSLTLLEMQAIQAHYAALDRDPSVVELETLAQTWSEHCKHKTFAGRIELELPAEGRTESIDNLLKQTIKRATLELDRPWCVSVFHDNAGVVEFTAPGEVEPGDAGWHVCFKVETHNHPSAIDPYGGAGTGVGGVVRDILGVGLGRRRGRSRWDGCASRP